MLLTEGEGEGGEQISSNRIRESRETNCRNRTGGTVPSLRELVVAFVFGM